MSKLLQTKQLFLIFILGASFIIFFCGILSDIHLGDEVLHFRQARYILELKKWPLYDPLNQSYGNQKWYYFDPVLWHTILAGIWKFTGVSQITAQCYQIMYFIMLVLATYFFAKELYDEKAAIYSSIVVATLPIVPALTVILHIDIPLAALSALSLVFLAKNKHLLAGLFVGIMFLTKRPTFVILPSFIILAFFLYKGKLKERVISTVMFLAVSLLFAYFSIAYRKAIESSLGLRHPFRRRFIIHQHK